MKAYLLSSGLIFALAAVRHLITTMQRLKLPPPDAWFVAGPALMLAACAGLAAWAFRLFTSDEAGP